MKDADRIDDDPELPEELFGDLRARLSSMADEGAPKLTRAARVRILDRVEVQGPMLVRESSAVREPGARPRWGLIGLGMAVAAALTFFVVDGLTAPAPRATGPACARWGAALANPSDGHLDLEQRGMAEFTGVLGVDALDGCTTELELRTGRVDVRADDLGGGTLRVVAGEISVEVRGTRFSVARDGAHVEVTVTEGHVVVEAPGEREIHLRAGERWSRGERPPRAEAPSPEAAPQAAPAPAEVAAPVEPRAELAEPGAEPPRRERSSASGRVAREASDRERLAQAERFWRAGERDAARRIFLRVGGGRGALAEAAWVRLARLELRSASAARAREAARTQRRRFPRSRLGAEALFIEADASRRLGDQAGAERAMRALRARYPDSPQARAASALGSSAQEPSTSDATHPPATSAPDIREAP